MHSYRHAFHAGNHGDVLKHAVLVHLLQYLRQKDAPFWYIDTHAGAGGYVLDRGYAAKRKEYATGIQRIWQRKDLPESLRDYVAIVRNRNPGDKLRYYPGSPELALELTRNGDRLRLFENHSTEVRVLESAMQTARRRVTVADADGFEALAALLPPPPRRALTMVDPSYEDKADYVRAIKTCRAALERFATGTYLIWYPRVQRIEVRTLVEKLRKLPCKAWLHAELAVAKAPASGYGLFGSGIFVINPPWTLPPAMQELLPYLKTILAQDDHAAYALDWSLP